MADKLYTSQELVQVTGIEHDTLQRYLEMLKPLNLETEGSYKEGVVQALGRLKILEERGKSGQLKHYIHLEGAERKLIAIDPQKEQAGLVPDGFVAIDYGTKLKMVRVIKVEDLPGSRIYRSEEIGDIKADSGSTVVKPRAFGEAELDDLELLNQIAGILGNVSEEDKKGLTQADIEALAKPTDNRGANTKLCDALKELGDEEIDISLD